MKNFNSQIKTMKAGLNGVASAILADVEPWLPARRKKQGNWESVATSGGSRAADGLSGRQDAALDGRPGGPPLHFKPALKRWAIAVLIPVLLAGAVSCKKSDANAKPDDVDYYTCAMHPSVKKQNPTDKCPICSMDLIPVLKKGAAGMDSTNAMSADMEHTGQMSKPNGEDQPGEFTVPVQRQQQIGVTYAAVQKQPFTHTVRAVGVVVAEISRRRDFVAPAPGSVISLGVASAGETVEKGQMLYTIYSPDLMTEEKNFADAAAHYVVTPKFGTSRTVGNIEAQFQAAKNRLLLWNLTTNQIAGLKEWTKRVPRDTAAIYAPFSGVVQRIGIVPGKNFGAGDELLELADLQAVQVWAQFYQDELPMLKKDLPITITSSSYPGEKFNGKISAVDPFINDATRTGRVRIDVANADLKLRPDMYVDVDLTMDMGEGIAVPFNAVLPTGKHNIVFVDKGEGKLEPRFIELGRKYGDFYEVKSGLNETERVVTSANFLIDAEAKVQGALKSW